MLHADSLFFVESRVKYRYPMMMAIYVHVVLSTYQFPWQPFIYRYRFILVLVFILTMNLCGNFILYFLINMLFLDELFFYLLLILNLLLWLSGLANKIAVVISMTHQLELSINLYTWILICQLLIFCDSVLTFLVFSFIWVIMVIWLDYI